MLLTGTFSRAIDEKLRIAIPKPLREALAKGSSAKDVLYVAPGTDGSLALYCEEALGQLASRLAQASPTHWNGTAMNTLRIGPLPASAHLFTVNPLYGRGVDSLVATRPSIANRIRRLRKMMVAIEATLAVQHRRPWG